MKAGFVGLGRMGLPMAINLHKAGFEVYGKNRSAGKEKSFQDAGGQIAESLSWMAQQVEVIFTCLPLPQDVEDVYLGTDGLLAHAKEGLVLVDCSTVSPQLNRQIYDQAEERGVHFLDAPVSGGTTGAEAGTLSIMVGGKREISDWVQPLLKAMGQHIYYVGSSGSGSAVKLINQLLVGIHTQGVSEAFALGEQAGLDQELLYDILSNSFAQSRIMDRHYKQFIEKDQFAAGFAIQLLAKDLNLAAEMGAQSGVQLAAGRRIQALLNRATAGGYAELDMAGMYNYQQDRDRVNREKGRLKHFAVFLPMLDADKSAEFRPQHLQFLADRRQEGKLHANGRFVDGAGGLVIYRASSYEEVEGLVRQDPYIVHGARTYEIHEWEIVLADG